MTVARITPLASDPTARRETALAHLATLVDLHDRGMREPLPLYGKTSAAYAAGARAGNKAAIKAARAEWTSKKFAKEDKEPEHELVLGGVLSLDDILDEPPRPDDEGEGWQIDDPTRLGRYARRLWDGLLEREEVTTL